MTKLEALKLSHTYPVRFHICSSLDYQAMVSALSECEHRALREHVIYLRAGGFP